MTNKARIFVAGRPVGVLEKDGDSYIFTYDQDYPEDGRPVSLTMMPTIKRHITMGRLPPFFEGLMYEGWMQRLASGVTTEVGGDDMGHISYLIGKCAESIGDVEIARFDAGSVQKMQPITIESATEGSASRGIYAQCLICFRHLPTPGHNKNYHERCSLSFFGTTTPPAIPFHGADLERLALRSISSGNALPGVQPKLPIFYAAGDSYFILKPQVSGVRCVPEIENIWMRLFESLGEPVAKSALVEMGDGDLAYVTRRFDRLPGGQKLHVEDFAQLLGKSIVGNEKFDASVADMVKVLREKSSPRARIAAVERLFKLSVLNIALGNSDAHLKNHAIIGLWPEAVGQQARVVYTLAPAYDILPTGFLSKNSRQSSALRINGKTSDITPKDLRAEAEESGLKASLVDDILGTLAASGSDIARILHSSVVPEAKVGELVRQINASFRSLGVTQLPTNKH